MDHVSELGLWAVRGLLCHDCNVHAWTTSAARWSSYLAHPWYREIGRDVEPTQQPPIGTVVCVASSGRHWKRGAHSWERQTGRPKSLSWELLNRRYGPYNLARENGIAPARKGHPPTSA